MDIAIGLLVVIRNDPGRVFLISGIFHQPGALSRMMEKRLASGMMTLKDLQGGYRFSL